MDQLLGWVGWVGGEGEVDHKLIFFLPASIVLQLSAIRAAARPGNSFIQDIDNVTSLSCHTTFS